MKIVYERIRVFDEDERVSTRDGWGDVVFDNFYALGDKPYNDCSFSHKITVRFSSGIERDYGPKEIFSEGEVNAG